MDRIEDNLRYSSNHYSQNRGSRNHPLSQNQFCSSNSNDFRYDASYDYDSDEDDDQQNQEFDDQYAYDESERHKKKQRLGVSGSRENLQNYPVDWSERQTSVLLEVWGDRFVQLGRNSLRSEDWLEVAEKVSEITNLERSDMDCRNRLDTLKKKYKKEREKVEDMRGGYVSKWVFFNKMDMLLNSFSSSQQWGLACGIDSGEYVFMNPRVYLNRSNGLDEMMDSPGESESDGSDDEENGKAFGGEEDDDRSFRMLADSIQKFGEIYEKIENGKRQQMMELEKMRVSFQRELDLQKKQILDKAQAEIAKIRQGDEDDTDDSADNPSG